jgi:hypothetical protein
MVLTLPSYVMHGSQNKQRHLLYVTCASCWPGPTRPADIQLKRTTTKTCHIYTLLPPDNGLLASPKHVELY